MNDILYLDCYLELHGELLKQILDLNKLAVSYGSQIDFSSRAKPHITLYMGLFPGFNEDKIREKFISIREKFSGIEIQPNGFCISSEGYVFLEIEKTKELIALHEKIVRKLNSLRNGIIRQKYAESMTSFSFAEREMIENYGFPWVLGLFNPHITIGKFAGEIDNNFLQKLELSADKGNLTKLDIGFVGDNGTVLGKKFLD
jgi:2'-5' RNA ligase